MHPICLVRDSVQSNFQKSALATGLDCMPIEVATEHNHIAANCPRMECAHLASCASLSLADLAELVKRNKAKSAALKCKG